jgi:hypothetical protein
MRCILIIEFETSEAQTTKILLNNKHEAGLFNKRSIKVEKNVNV